MSASGKRQIEDIHPSAVVSRHAELGPGVRIGPYSNIGEGVTIGSNTVVRDHVIVEGKTSIGENNIIYPFVCIGTPPQDVGYRGEDTRVTIGDKNVIREYVTVHRATTKQDWVTVVGNNNYLMAYSHVAHDCILGDRVIMANVATLGGHITVGDQAILGGLVAVHQFVRIGEYAFVGAKSAVDRDVPPYMMSAGPRAKLYGINRKGLSRSGFSQDAISGLIRAFRIIWRDNRTFRKGIDQVKRELESFPELNILLNFLEGSKRGVLR